MPRLGGEQPGDLAVVLRRRDGCERREPGQLDLSVVFNPPGGAAGFQKQIVVETFADLSLKTAAPNFVAAQINPNSKLIRVPANYVPPATTPAGFPTAPAMFPDSGVLNLLDLGSPAVTFLVLQATDPASWPAYFGVSAQASPNPASFDLQVMYNPASGGVGVALPVAVERYAQLHWPARPLPSIPPRD